MKRKVVLKCSEQLNKNIKNSLSQRTQPISKLTLIKYLQHLHEPPTIQW